MPRSAVVLILMVVFLTMGGFANAELYKYTDDNGVLHVVMSLDEVPAKYRDQVQIMKTDVTPAPGSRPPRPAPEPTAEPPADALAAADGLARFEVPYTNEGTARRVIIPVTFNDSVTAPMALDTGSPGMVISFELAVRLGIFQRDSGTLVTAAGGIGGAVPAIQTIVDSVSVDAARDEFIPTTVTFGISDAFDGLIGMDFLTNYNITVDTRRQVVVFQETEPLPNSRGGHDEAWWRKTFEDFRAMSDGWRAYVKSAKERSGTRVTPFAEFQAREADRLLQRLHLYASANAVPRHWR